MAEPVERYALVATVCSEQHPALVDHNPREPCGELGGCSILVEVFERLNTRVLNLVACAGAITKNELRQFGALTIVSVQEFSEGVGISLTRAFDEFEITGSRVILDTAIHAATSLTSVLLAGLAHQAAVWEITIVQLLNSWSARNQSSWSEPTGQPRRCQNL
jgi:hypothetical protein